MPNSNFSPVPARPSSGLEVVEALVVGASGRFIALPLRDIERVFPAVALTPAPGASSGICGVIDVAGCLVPVLRAADLLPLSPTEKNEQDAASTKTEANCQQPDLSDSFLLVNCGFSAAESLWVALWVDHIGEVVSIGADLRRGALWHGWQSVALPQGLVWLGEGAALLTASQREWAGAMNGQSNSGEAALQTRHN